MDWSHIVVVHGVGDAKPGDTLRGIAAVITESMPGTSYEQSDLVVRDLTYPRLKGRGGVSELIEVNWADLVRTNRSSLGVVTYLVRLIYAMLDLADRWLDNRPSFCVFLYRSFFEMTAGWSVLFSIYVMFLASYSGTYERWVVFVAGSLLVIGATVILWLWAGRPAPFATLVGSVYWLVPGAASKRNSELRPMFFDGGLVWSVVFLWAGGYVCLSCLPHQAEVLTIFSTGWLEKWITNLLVVFSWTALLEVLIVWMCLRMSGLAALTRLTFLCVPLMALSMAGTCLRIACLIPASNGDRFNDWQSWYLRSLPYDLKFAEYVMASAIGGIGIIGLFGVGVYVARRWRPQGNYGKSGSGAQHWIIVMLWCCPIILVGAGILIYCHTHRCHWSNTEPILNIYRISALRIVPYLSYLVPGIGAILTVAADIVFFVLPPSHPFCIQTKAKQRLKNLLDLIQADAAEAKILVIAHSQGSVIAVTALGKAYSHVELVTLGSPIDSLYKRFLGWQRDQASAPPNWANYYRLGDYIGGKIESEPPGNKPDDKPVPMPKAGHINYWSDPAIMKAVLRLP